MTKLRLSLRNSVRIALNSLTCLLLACLCGCSSSTTSTFSRQNITQSIQDICKEEYALDIKAKLAGDTLWIYIPVEDILTETDPPVKYTEEFNIETNESEIKDGLVKVNYNIKPVPKIEKYQEKKYNEKVIEKINNVMIVLRRVIFSMERKKSKEPAFYSIIAADIKNGLIMWSTLYYLDLKKVSYGFISWTEYQHRNISDIVMAPQVKDDKEGKNIQYSDITLEEFIAAQISHRIKLKFQKPEVDENADIDKEIRKIITTTLKIYGFSDFYEAQLYNSLTKNKIIINRKAVLEHSTE
ncbi:MAG: hypothetical protein COV72_05170 [Candidatus Omnitrophica bacterium CG11_big_fil_rev_8_21_14_0_20_42_13]|uniref:Uncharacterized protein n=1 Tax=Candidatus Ghiorseimicrobium undicola TaxID=1974746 RepID=A0A2H0LZE7_9BACT|nr:MAG: hypothetical protein COV72_05170 [Candidatus Omnitrophica bacterium CG11_big_fil_rev_8_21_14_0_20_42_13]